MSQVLYHLIPGYTLYDFQRSLVSSNPMAIKARDAVVSGAIAGTSLIIATEHAMKIQRATGSASGLLTNRWFGLSRTLPALATVGGVATAGFAALVLYTALNEPSRTDTSLNIPYRSISGRHHGKSYLS